MGETAQAQATEGYLLNTPTTRMAFYAKKSERRRWLQTIKRIVGCEQCGARPDDPKLLHFDHIDPADNHSIADPRAVDMSWSLDHIIDELSRCQVLCASCHASKTQQDMRRGRFSLRALRRREDIEQHQIDLLEGVE